MFRTAESDGRNASIQKNCRIPSERATEDRGGYLADEESRRVYSDLFKYRCTKERKYLKGHEDKEIYFNKLTLSGIKNNPGKVFVDGGAFDGDTVKAFMKAAGDQFGHIFAFETEEKNLKKLRAFVDQNKLAEKITVYPYALWSERTTLLVDDEKGMNQKVTEKGTHKIPADTIDHLLKNEKVSFIKMDIEGAEMEALKGAAEVIKANKPGLAISIYHKPNDFYEIPLYIMELVPEYRLYVRHHSCFFADTVLYAVI